MHNVIKRKTILKDIHKQYIMHQLLKATKYLHSANVIHRDQKPSNILLNQECHIKLCDFGLARSLTQEAHESEFSSNPALTEYVATRWYRAPEILLASPKYTKGVDMWSIGCILGEMLLGTPIFPGTSTFNQLERILKYIPQPSKADIDSIQSHYGPSVIERASSGPKKSLDDLVPHTTKESLDLLRRLLQFNPNKRITAEESLTHPYVISFHNSKEEIVKGYDVVPQLNDNVRLTIEEYRNKLYQFIQSKPANVRISNSAQSLSNHHAHQQSTPPQSAPQNSQKQGNLQRSNTYHYQQQQQQQQRQPTVIAESPDVQSELMEHYNQQSNSKINYQSSYNNQYDSANQSDDNNSVNSDVTPPQYKVAGQASSGVGAASSNYSRKKQPMDYQNNSQNNNALSSSMNGQLLNSIVGSGYSGVAFGRTTHSNPHNSNVYSKNHAQQKSYVKQKTYENPSSLVTSFLTKN